MTVKYIRFILIKLILVIFSAIAAFLTALFLTGTVSETTDSAFVSIVRIIPSIVFFAFIYSFESKIKTPEDIRLPAKYYLTFALRETSVYAVFLLPVTIAAAAASIDITANGAAAAFFLPHMIPALFGVPLILNYIVMCALYGAVSSIAHMRAVKKTRSVPSAAYEYEPDGEDQDAADDSGDSEDIACEDDAK